MSLKPLQADKPLGQFDGLDSEVLTLLGGEVVTFSQVVASSDLSAADVDDGYQNPNLRTVVKKASGNGERALMLADDGITGYGTLFGSVVGGTVGKNTSGTVVGPHTATGSGKVTCWAQPGLYGVSLDAVHADLQPNNPAVDAGLAVHFELATAKLCLSGSSGAGTTVVGRFVEFQTNGSLVTTPNNLAGTFNPPDGVLTTTDKTFDYAVLWFAPPIA